MCKRLRTLCTWWWFVKFTDHRRYNSAFNPLQPEGVGNSEGWEGRGGGGGDFVLRFVEVG